MGWQVEERWSVWRVGEEHVWVGELGLRGERGEWRRGRG